MNHGILLADSLTQNDEAIRILAAAVAIFLVLMVLLIVMINKSGPSSTRSKLLRAINLCLESKSKFFGERWLKAANARLNRVRNKPQLAIGEWGLTDLMHVAIHTLEANHDNATATTLQQMHQELLVALPDH